MFRLIYLSGMLRFVERNFVSDIKYLSYRYLVNGNGLQATFSKYVPVTGTRTPVITTGTLESRVVVNQRTPDKPPPPSICFETTEHTTESTTGAQ